VTANLWIAAGGELPFQSGNTYTFNDVSAAMAIFANAPGSPTPATQYDKGIVFGAGGISSGVAVALPETYSMTWFNSNNQVTNAIFSNATTATNSAQLVQKIEFSDFGTLFVDGSGNPQFRVANNIGSAANYVMASANATTLRPSLIASGTDTNIQLYLGGTGNGGAAVQGQTTGCNATMGVVGEYICAQVTNGGSPTGCVTNSNTPVLVTTNAPANVTSITLTPGDWDVWGSIAELPAGTTTTQNIQGTIPTVSATIGAGGGPGAGLYLPLSFGGGVGPRLPVGMRQVNVATTTTVYLVTQVGFSNSTCAVIGEIAARRRD
jgi:hypothetical protein